MSMEMMVFSDRQLSSKSDWQDAIASEGLSVTILTELPVSELEGFVPVRSNDAMTGFECFHSDAREVFQQYAGMNFGRSWLKCLTFRWGSDLDECLAAYAAAASYAKASNGILFDPQESTLMSWQETLAEIPRIRREAERWSALPRTLALRIGGD